MRYGSPRSSGARRARRLLRPAGRRRPRPAVAPGRPAPGRSRGLDGPPDVVRGGAALLDQLVGRGHANQAEREPLVGGLASPVVVHGPDGDEEVIRERELQRAVDLVEEDHYPPVHLPRDLLAEELDQALVRRGGHGRAPPCADVNLEPQLPRHHLQQPEVPVVGLLDRSQGAGDIDERAADPLPCEPATGPVEQAGLAHLPRAKNVAVLALFEVLEQLVIRRPDDVDGLPGVDREPDLDLQPSGALAHVAVLKKRW